MNVAFPRLATLFTGFAMLAGAGCGSKTEEIQQNAATQKTTAPAPAIQPAAPIVAKPVSPVPVSPTGGTPAPANSSKRPEIADPPEPEAGFEWVTVAPDDRAYELLPPANEPAKDLFAVAPPRSGVDSSLFIAAESARGTAAGRPTASVSLPDGLKPILDAGYAADGYPRRVFSEKDGMEMSYVPPGVIRMGVENGPPEATPVLAVPLDGFYIDVTEVTLAHYEAYRKDVKESKKQFKPEPLNPLDPEDFAVRGIPWSEARLYAQWAGKTLPTEAQWEMAARGPSAFLHPWGNDAALWPQFRPPEELSPVKFYRTDQSIYGVFDMAGNVREWVSDLYSATAYKDSQNTPTSALKNWEGPKKASVDNTRVVKGNGPGWSVWQRAPGKVGDKIPDVGFRCVVSLKSAASKKTN